MKFYFSAIFAGLTIVSLSGFAQAPAATPAIPVASAEAPEIRDFQKVEDNWATALNQRDQYGLELVLSPLFVGVSATGDVTTRNQQIVSVINQEDKTAATDMRVVTVRMLGDVAVTNGTYTYSHKGTSGPVEEKGVFTHVFQKQHGNWVCLNAQRTLIRVDAAGKNKAKAKGESKADLPFHIPLFSKGDKNNSKVNDQN
jgi:ketosteroid isomerase-like protein